MTSKPSLIPPPRHIPPERLRAQKKWAGICNWMALLCRRQASRWRRLPPQRRKSGVPRLLTTAPEDWEEWDQNVHGFRAKAGMPSLPLWKMGHSNSKHAGSIPKGARPESATIAYLCLLEFGVCPGVEDGDEEALSAAESFLERDVFKRLATVRERGHILAGFTDLHHDLGDITLADKRAAGGAWERFELQQVYDTIIEIQVVLTAKQLGYAITTGLTFESFKVLLHKLANHVLGIRFFGLAEDMIAEFQAYASVHGVKVQKEIPQGPKAHKVVPSPMFPH